MTNWVFFDERRQCLERRRWADTCTSDWRTSPGPLHSPSTLPADRSGHPLDLFLQTHTTSSLFYPNYLHEKSSQLAIRSKINWCERDSSGTSFPIANLVPVRKRTVLDTNQLCDNILCQCTCNSLGKCSDRSDTFPTAATHSDKSLNGKYHSSKISF